MKKVAAIIFLFLLLLPSCKYFKGKKLFGGKKDKVMAEWLMKQDSVRVADSIKKVQDQILAAENARLDSIRMAEEAEKALASQYNIIVGSFITPAYAQEWVNEYLNRGYDPKIIKLEGTSFELVSAESHKSFRKAVSRLAQFQDTVQIDAWLYVKR